jgi:hypothetical protein
MASAAKITINDTTPTLLWAGVGNVVFRTQATAFLGGSSVTAADGFLLNGRDVALNVNSPDEIYGISGSGNVDVYVLEAL